MHSCCCWSRGQFPCSWSVHSPHRLSMPADSYRRRIHRPVPSAYDNSFFSGFDPPYNIWRLSRCLQSCHCPVRIFSIHRKHHPDPHIICTIHHFLIHTALFLQQTENSRHFITVLLHHGTHAFRQHTGNIFVKAAPCNRCV